MLAILNYLNAHYLPIFQPILMILVSKFMFYKALSYKTYLLLGLLSPLRKNRLRFICKQETLWLEWANAWSRLSHGYLAYIQTPNQLKPTILINYYVCVDNYR